jgi:hypothetical protein
VTKRSEPVEFGTVVQSWLPLPLATALRQKAAVEGVSVSSEVRNAIIERLRADEHKAERGESG